MKPIILISCIHEMAHFFLSDYNSGVQLRDDKKVLINLNLPNNEIRTKLIECLYESIEATKEVVRASTFKEIDASTAPVPPGLTSC